MLFSASRKTQIWNYVDKGVGSGDPSFYPELQRYSSQIVRSKRPSLLKRHAFVFHDHIAHILKEGCIETVRWKNVYETTELLSIDEMRGFFEKACGVIDHYLINYQNIRCSDESWVLPEGKAPGCYVP